MAHPRDVRIAELEAQIEAAKAEIAQIQADAKTEIAEVKTGDAMNLKAAAGKRGLKGNRDADGNLITEKGDIAGSSDDLTTGEVSGELGDAMAFAKAAGNIPTEQMIEEEIPVHPAIIQQIEEDDIEGDERKEEDDIEGDERKDERSEGMVNIGIDREQGRTKGAFDDIERSEKPGWEMAEGSNAWSINEKDDHWKTQDGYDEAVALYGSKPAWVKEPTLVWNPAEQEYEEIEEEEFEDLEPYKKRISL